MKGWGFSKGDMVANALGLGLLIGNELLFNEQKIRYKFSYWQSKYARQANGYLGNDALDGLLYDYNGHTNWLTMGMQQLFFTKKVPDWFSLAVGYSANGMFGEFKIKRHIEAWRYLKLNVTVNYCYHPDIDWTKIPTRSKFLKTLFHAMVFVKTPFPALELIKKEK